MKITFVSLVAEPLHSAFHQLCGDLENSGLPIFIHESDDWTQATRLIEDGTAQAGAMCGLLYALLKARGVPLVPVAGPVLQLQSYKDQPVYWPVVVVPENSSARNLNDLQGSRWLVNESDSYSGFRGLMAELTRQELRDRPFADVVFTGSHQASLEQLLLGEGDFTVLDSTFWDHLSPAKLTGLKTLQTLPPRAAPLLVCHPDRQDFRSAVLALKSYPAPLKSLAPVVDSDLDPIRQDWNLSLEAPWPSGASAQSSTEFVLGDLARESRDYTLLQQAQDDQQLLQQMAQDLLRCAAQRGQETHANGMEFFDLGNGGLQYPLYLLKPELLERPELTVIGFTSKLNPDAELGPLFEADHQLVQEFPKHEGFISYSSQEFEPGRWANLAVFQDRASKDRWAANALHTKAIRDHSAGCYHHIRLHLARWPSKDQTLEFLCTRYLDYTDAKTWYGVRTYA